MTVYVSGPIFNGSLARQIDAAIDEARTEIADDGVNLLHASASQFKNPSGNWESQIRTDQGVEDTTISDLAIYNAWLEGVSSMNQHSRFKGYRMWRLTTQELQAGAADTVERVLERRLG